MTSAKSARNTRARRAPGNLPGDQLSTFAVRLSREWKKLGLPITEAAVVVAVSGGADSVALLLALDELIKSKKLSVDVVVAHLNHKLRGKESSADAKWVASLAKELGYRAKLGAVDVRAGAGKGGDNLEQAARRARYEFLEQVARAHKATTVLAAHTLDDQAETALLNLLRGSGGLGLSGIEAVRPIHGKSQILLARPLLSWAIRSETQAFCRHRRVDFRSDEMNEDETFARVRVRNQLLPLMQSFNPRFIETLARTTEILREDNTALESAAARLLELSLEDESHPCALRPDLLRLAQPALRRRALRQWITACRGDLRRIEHVHVLALEKFLFNTKSGRVIELPGGCMIVRNGGRFLCQTPRSKP